MMPTKQEHLDKESRDAAVEVDLVAAEYPEWALTALFYRAVHLVDAFFAGHGLHHNSHASRNLAVARLLTPITREYMSIYGRALVARYEPLSETDWPAYEAARTAYAAVEQHVRPLL